MCDFYLLVQCLADYGKGTKVTEPLLWVKCPVGHLTDLHLRDWVTTSFYRFKHWSMPKLSNSFKIMPLVSVRAWIETCICQSQSSTVFYCAGGSKSWLMRINLVWSDGLEKGQDTGTFQNPQVILMCSQARVTGPHRSVFPKCLEYICWTWKVLGKVFLKHMDMYIHVHTHTHRPTHISLIPPPKN